MDKLQIERLRDCLQSFDFQRLFIEELGWSHVKGTKSIPVTVQEHTWQATPIAALSGVVAFMVVGLPEQPARLAIHTALAQHTHENLILFVDSEKSAHATQSLWLWVKREGSKRFQREHLYVKGQPGDLFISKISGIVVDINELDEHGHFPLAQLVDRMKSALDVERVTKKFFKEYDAQRLVFVELIQGIPDERERRWYASVLMNRLMFVWFLQRKHFLDGSNTNYLTDKLAESQSRGKDGFYTGFLQALFFEGFAKPAEQRTSEAKRLIGDIRYLNGGLFIPHRLEREYGPAIRVPDAAFENLFHLFAAYSWNLNDTPGGLDNEINPDVLGYIFEKYINQKAFGAYYTRPEITEYLCERTIHRLILARINQFLTPLPLGPGVREPVARKFDSVADLLMQLDAGLCRELLTQVLPDLKLLDPSCGSGAFLVAAMKTLINIYSAVIGRIKFLNDKGLTATLKKWEAEHKSLAYFIKRTIISDNLFGVDIMEEATEIAKLRLFLALVASAQTVDQLEPLPNIDFNIVAGNSLVGLLHVDAHEYESKAGAQGDLFRKSYRHVLDEKNRKIDLYRHTAAWTSGMDISSLKAEIESHKTEAQATLNELLLSEWHRAGIKFEEATWDSATGKEGKPKKRNLTIADIEALQPFHWGFEFDEILNKRGGFDAIITNPPWEIFKPNAKEFFQEHSELVSKNKMTIKEFEKEQAKLLKKSEIRAAWLEYLSRFPHVSAWYRVAPQFKSQSAIVGGKKTGSDINLYKLFTEQCANLLREGGDCGIVIPSGIYTDLGAKGLRDLLFDHNKVTGLFCFENRKEIFEGVDSRFKFVVLTFEKGGNTERFPAAFMRHDTAELAGFPREMGLRLSVELIRRLSPDSHSVMEFKSETDIHIAEKMLRFPLLGEEIEGKWNVRLTNEFHMTNDSHLFKTEPGKNRLPLFEGKMIWHFEHRLAEPRYWVEMEEADSALRSARIRNLKQQFKKLGIEDEATLESLIRADQVPLDHHRCRFGFRDIAASTNERAMICTVLPPHVFAGNTLNLLQPYDFDVGVDGWKCALSLDVVEQLFVVACFDSFIVDWLLRQKITSHLNMFYVYQVPVPRLRKSDRGSHPIAERAARLICTAPEFAGLAKEVGLKSHHDGVTDPAERARLRAELDGLIAHLYGLTEAEFAHVLSTFPLVAEPVKIAALNAYRDVKRGLIQ
ncbi:type II restriction enzyme methyltransferase subunit [Candidatus Symbiobacter mobilis CR]|uniref:site-specific DNA-methyltransferase (adenine-specific) n=2 Tax=Candidatus Symbiobacter TaxID=1436289 RepID=U5N923_9BURK|nr:type II restriction enzyme methyltransferase subunit [Candidatus Symbiobacter mobilis CR]